MARPTTNPDTFWDRIERRDMGECWPWLGSTKNGYGRFSIKSIEIYAHRHAYAITHGHPPAGREMHVMHKCNNKLCCNPAHLELGTAYENDKAARRDGLTPIGARHPNYKVTPELARQILADNRPQRALAKTYGVSQGYISKIKLGIAKIYGAPRG